MKEFIVVTTHNVSLVKAASAKEVLAASDVLRAIPYKKRVRRIHDIDLAHIASDLAIMLRSGIDLSTALNSIIESKEDDVAVAMFHVKHYVEKGMDVADAFAQVGAFPEQFVKAVKVGSERGKLQEVFQHLGTYYSAKGDVRNKIAIATVMPDATLVITAVVFIFMLHFLFPKLKEFARDMGVRHFGMFTSSFIWMYNNIIIVGIIVFVLLALYFRYKNAVLMVIPRVGKTYKSLLDHLDSYAVSSISGLVLSTGMEVTEALKYSLESIENKKVKKALKEAITEIERGSSISRAFAKKDIPSALRSVVVIGERSGNMAEMFNQLSDSLKESITNDIKEIENKMPIAMTLAIGPVVFAVLFSFYYPYLSIMTKITEMIRK